MKTRIRFTQAIAALVVLSLSGTAGAQTITAADSTGLPGDNFSLEGALELFKKSESPEDFEKMLNAENNKVNNLDLNGDGEIDYIRVIDKMDNGVHVFVLQDVVSDNESQDIAVIELEKTGNEKAVAQIVGDEDIYGEETIIEPTETVRTNAGTSSHTTIVNVWAWPSVRYVYGPAYTVYASPWGWHARPVWWRPWRPVRHTVFYSYHAPYRPHYTVVHRHRVVYAPRVYRPVRTTSVMVTSRHQPAVTHYRTTRSTTTTQRSTTNRSRSTTTTQRRGGEVKRQSTTVHRSRESTPKPSSSGSSSSGSKGRGRGRD